jgi:predicted CoA-binding protein
MTLRTSRRRVPVSRTIDEILRESNVVAVVGASRDPRKPAGRVPLELQERGFTVIPVTPTVDRLWGERAYASLADLDRPVDVVEVFRPSEEAPAVARQAVAIGARTLWLQLEITSEEARRIAEDAGIDFVEDRCMGRESARLEIRKG